MDTVLRSASPAGFGAEQICNVAMRLFEMPTCPVLSWCRPGNCNLGISPEILVGKSSYVFGMKKGEKTPLRGVGWGKEKEREIRRAVLLSGSFWKAPGWERNSSLDRGAAVVRFLLPESESESLLPV